MLDNTKRITSASYNGATWPVGKPEQSKTLTLGAAAPSTVTPDSGKVLSSVPVVLDTSVIKAENIAKDVTMLGITGTHEGGGEAEMVTVTIGGMYERHMDEYNEGAFFVETSNGIERIVAGQPINIQVKKNSLIAVCFFYNAGMIALNYNGVTKISQSQEEYGNVPRTFAFIATADGSIIA